MASSIASSAASAAAAAAASSSAAAAEIQHALTGLRESIASLTIKHGLKRQPLLVAVSKTKPIEAVLHAYAAGCRHFGENYVQELVEKAASPSLSASAAPGLQWHFIGHLQSNKVKQVARIPNLAMVESVDSRKLASELNKACLASRAGAKDGGTRPRLPVLIQVNTSGEDSKFGCAPEEAVGLFGHVLATCPALEPRGLMTIGRLADSPQPDCFDLLAKIRREVLEKFSAPSPATSAVAATSATGEANAASGSNAAAAAAAAPASSSAAPAASSAPAPAVLTVDADSFEMSMGMSGDYACAMERGSTIVRVGSTIFGAREYPNKPAPPPRTPSPSKGEKADKDS